MLKSSILTRMSNTIIKTFNKNEFNKTVKVIGIKVETKKISTIIKVLHGYLLNVPKIKNVIDIPESIKDKEIPEKMNDKKKKAIILSRHVKDTKLSGLPDTIKKNLLKYTNEMDMFEHEVQMNYMHLSVEEILTKILPIGSDIPSSFETIGHIAHLNIRDKLLPYKNIIGQVILEKNKSRIKCVVNKIKSIETEFRTFPMEIIAKVDIKDNNNKQVEKDLMDVELYESKAKFQFNYTKVYWNSRLQKEHQRIIELIYSKNHIVCDMMCGIGPFAIPLAMQKNIKVYANDLNPYSYEYLNNNIKINKVNHLIESYNLDGRIFMEKLYNKKVQFTHVIMNLPATAIEFLDVFIGKLDYWCLEKTPLPFIHCYCFSDSNNPEEDIIKRAESIMGFSLSKENNNINIHNVRDVSPKKIMLCLSFQLTKEMVFTEKRINNNKRKQSDVS